MFALDRFSLSLARVFHRLDLLVHLVDFLLAELQRNISLEFKGSSQGAVLLRVELWAQDELFGLLKRAQLVLSRKSKHVLADLIFQLIVGAKLSKALASQA